MSKQEYPGLLISAARRRIRQVVSALARPYDLSSQQFWVIVTIRAYPGLSLTELGERQRLDQPTASRIVDALAKRGLVKVAGDERDRRRLRLRLTPAARPLANRLYALAEQHRAAVVEGMSETDLDVLRGGLRRVIDNLDRFHARVAKRRPVAPLKPVARPRRVAAD